MKSSLLLFPFMLGLILFSCNSGEKISDGRIVKPAFETAALEFQKFEVDAASGKTFSLPSGTKIIIPPNAFSDKEGDPVSGNVSIKYREFHDAADILLGGIPMAYDSAGQPYHLQTAGMFEIVGYQKSNPVYIANDKKIEVKMGSAIGEPNYNNYYLDTTQGNWIYKSQSSVAVNEEKEKKIREKLGTPVEQPIQPTSHDPDKFVFDMKINTKAYPELKDFHNIIWQYAGNSNSDSIDPEKNDWIFNEKWTNVELQLTDRDQSLFTLHLNNKTKNFHSLVKPVFAGKDLEKAKETFKKKQEDYQKYLSRRKEELRRIQNEMDFIRSFDVLVFGIHNFDIIYKYETVRTIAADFIFDQDVDRSNTRVFLITGDNRVVMAYKEAEWKNFTYPLVKGNLLVAIMPGDKIAVCKDLQNEKSTDQVKERTFKFKTIPKTINKSQDLREAFAML